MSLVRVYLILKQNMVIIFYSYKIFYNNGISGGIKLNSYIFKNYLFNFNWDNSQKYSTYLNVIYCLIILYYDCL